MSTYYRLLVITFILSLVAATLFLIFYGSAIISLIRDIEGISTGTQDPVPPRPEEVLRILFNPALILSGVVAALSSMANTIAGILLVARNKSLKEGERVLWILGFILLNTVTNIIFLALKKAHNLVPVNAASGPDTVY